MHAYLLLLVEGQFICTWNVRTVVPIVMLAHETLETKQPEGKPSLRVMEGKAGARLTAPINPAERQRDWPNAPWTAFPLYWSLQQWTPLEERSNWPKEKGKKNQNYALRKKLARTTIYIFVLHICLVKGWKKDRRERNREGLRTNGVLFICLGLKYVDNPKRRAKGKKTKDATMS